MGFPLRQTWFYHNLGPEGEILIKSFVELFVHVDDFCQGFLSQLENQLLQNGVIHRRPTRAVLDTLRLHLFAIRSQIYPHR